MLAVQGRCPRSTKAIAQELNRSWRRRVWDLGIEAKDAIEIAEKIDI
jgi:hypothetical protein